MSDETRATIHFDGHSVDLGDAAAASELMKKFLAPVIRGRDGGNDMGEATPIHDEVRGAALVAVLQQDIQERADEVLHDLVHRIQETGGWANQSATIQVKFKGGDEEKPAQFEVFAKLANTTNSTVRPAKAQRSGPDGKGPVQLVMFTRDA